MKKYKVNYLMVFDNEDETVISSPAPHITIIKSDSFLIQIEPFMNNLAKMRSEDGSVICVHTDWIRLGWLDKCFTDMLKLVK